MRKTAGFTMVELLVVIAIIGVLSAIIYVSFDSAREQARTRALQTELKETQLALEAYRSQYSRYPLVDTGTQPNCTDTNAGVMEAQQGGIGFNGSTDCSGFVSYIGAGVSGTLAPDFIPTLPLVSDSNNPNCTMRYFTDAGGNWFKLVAERCVEGAIIGEDEAFSQCPSSCGTCNGTAYNATYVASADFNETMAVYSSGGECQ